MNFNPRIENNNLGFMICFHQKYTLGDDHYIEHQDYTSWAHMGQQLAKKFNAAVILPLYLYDHSGITMATTPFYDHWDSGQVGFILVSKSAIARWFNTCYCTKKLIEKARYILEGEVEEYNLYLTGEDDE